MTVSMTVRAVAMLACAILCWAAADGFEAASVKPNLANDRIVTVQLSPDGRFMARGYTLALLIQRAYAVRYRFVLGGPEWAYSDRFDIAAKASVPGRFTEAEMRPMLAKLLTERFRLRVRTEMKETPGYALEVGRGGEAHAIGEYRRAPGQRSDDERGVPGAGDRDGGFRAILG